MKELINMLVFSRQICAMKEDSKRKKREATHQENNAVTEKSDKRAI